MFGQHAHRRVLGNRRRRARFCRAGGIKAKLLTFLVVALIIVGILPIIVAKTPLRNVLLSSALPRDSVKVTLGDASLNWFGSPSLSTVDVKDAAGDTLLTAESIKIDRAPLALAFNSQDLGTIQIVRPVIHIKVRPDGSNLEDVLQKFVADAAANEAAPAAAAKKPTVFVFQLVEATILADDLATGRQWRLQNVNAQYDARNSSGLGLGSLAGDIAVSDHGAAPLPAGRFAVALRAADGGLQQITLQADQIALALVEPYLRRHAPGGQLSGTLSGQATAAWTGGQTPLAGLTATGSLSVDRLDASAPQLEGDRIRLARIELPFQITAQPSGLAIESLQLRSDVCQFNVKGRLDPNLTAGRNDVELRGTVDGAKLAAMLPNTLKVKKDIVITSATIDVVGSVKPITDGQAVTGSVRTAQIAGTKSGQPLSWDQPINADFALHRSTSGALALDSLQCDSKFLHVEAAGTSREFTANAAFDLNALSSQLDQFVDLSGIQLAGTGSAQLAWNQPSADKFSAKASTDFSQLRVDLGNGAVWAEPQLALRAEAVGSINPATSEPTRLEAAQLQINGQGDQLEARLVSPVENPSATAVFPIAVRSTGSIARWLTRVRPWFAPGQWNIDGGSDFTADLRLAGNAFEATNTKLVVTNLRATSPEWNIAESRIEFAGDARWNGATGELAANSAQLVSSTVAIAAKGVHYGGNQPGANNLSGAAAFRADLARLASWRRSPTQPPQYQPSGEFTGNIHFSQQSGRITGEINATGQNLVLASYTQPAARGAAPGYQTIWQEPTLKIQGATNYDATADRLSFDQFVVQCNTIQANVAGQIQKLSDVAECDLKGTLNYDLAQVTPLLRPYLGTGVQLTGREQARFLLNGQLSAPNTLSAQTVAYTPQSATRNPQSAISWSRRIRAQLELPWSGANVYGLPVGGGRLAAALGDGSLRIEPLNLAIGEGKLTAAPNIRFDPEPSELTLPAGPILTNVRISPEVSEAMLKFVAPVLAGATQSEGLFSMQIEGARVPLAEPRRADSKGQLTVHSVRVTPGPMTAQWVGLAQQVEALVKRRDASSRQVTLVSVRDQQVNFQVTNGRVYHQQMEFQIGDIVLRSQGSVGLDETVALTLDIPIQDAWIAKEPLLSGLKGQSIQIPVSGTLTKPQMDQRAIAGITTQLLQKGAGQAVGNELNKALDKFLKPRK